MDQDRYDCKDPYKIDPSRSPLLPNSGYRRSGLLMAGLAGAILIVIGIIWSAGHNANVARNAGPPLPAAATTGSAPVAIGFLRLPAGRCRVLTGGRCCNYYLYTSNHDKVG